MPVKPPPLPPKQTKTTQTTKKPKKFFVRPWTGHGEGEKVVGYGASGVGKTTLFATMPNAIFLGLDDGGRKIRNPQTGKPVNRVEGIETFQDVRDALCQLDLWPTGASCVIDTATILESLAEPWMFENIPHEKGWKVDRIEGYGYGKGYGHLFDTIRLVIQDLDALVRRGVNVGLICQSMAVKKANPGGLDYLYEGPKLSHPPSEKSSVRLHVCEWADHVVKIGYQDEQVRQLDDSERTAKASGGTTRAVFVQPEPHFFAKTRTLKEPVISFDTPDDDSLWKFMFGGTND